MTKLIGSSTERRAVQIFSADENRVMGTVVAISTYRLSEVDIDFQFYPAAEGRPRELHTWFYPGDNVGLEFRPSPGWISAESGRRRSNATTSAAGGD